MRLQQDGFEHQCSVFSDCYCFFVYAQAARSAACNARELHKNERRSRHRGLRDASADAIVVITEILEDTGARQNRKKTPSPRPRSATPPPQKSAYSIFRHIVVVCASLRTASAETARPRETLSDDARAALRRFGHLQRVRVDVDH